MMHPFPPGGIAPGAPPFPPQGITGVPPFPPPGFVPPPGMAPPPGMSGFPPGAPAIPQPSPAAPQFVPAQMQNPPLAAPPPIAHPGSLQQPTGPVRQPVLVLPDPSKAQTNQEFKKPTDLKVKDANFSPVRDTL